MSTRAATALRQRIRAWHIPRQTPSTLQELAQWINPIIRGWIHYYGHFYKSLFQRMLYYLDRVLVRWAMRKYKKLNGRQRRATHWLGRIARREPTLFAHWGFGVRPAAGS